MMSTSFAPPHFQDGTAEPLRGILAGYAASHDVPVRLWRRNGSAWVLVATAPSSSPPAAAVGSSPPNAIAAPAAAPSAAAAPIETPVSSFLVEVVHVDPAEAARAASFLASVLTNALKHDEESRFFGRELAERYEEITLLYTISEVLGSVISLEQAATTILGEVIDTMGVNRAALWIHEPAEGVLRIAAAVGGTGQAGPISVDDDSSITASVFRNRRPTILEPGDEFPREEGDPAAASREYFLSVPVSYTPPHGASRTIGVINLIGRRGGGGFSAGDQKLITAIASQIGAAVENSRLVAESLRQERVDREMELAHDLQLKLLPSAERFRDRAEVAARCSPAESVGGDFYQLFRLPGNSFGVVIGDVSSHGFGAALIMALTMSAVAIHASEGYPPSEVLRRAHMALIDELESTEMYITLFYGVIDPAAGTLRYANAGHPHAFRMARSGAVYRLPVTNPPFGIVDLDRYDENTVEWSSGSDLLVLFTDGLSDALGPTDGEARLLQHIASRADQPLDDLIQSIFELERQIIDIPSDDRTAVLVRA